jgi:rare lipoprotein A
VKLSWPSAAALRVALFLAAAGLAAFEVQEGLASWYGGKFQGRRTASGELFDTLQFTAAHRTLPFGTVVLVTNLRNGRSVTVRINDRGPFIQGRIIDLSMAAATAIGLTGEGVTPVRIEPAPRAAAGPAAAAVSAGAFRLQLGSFRQRANAERLLARLRESGIAEAALEISGGLHRVLIRGLTVAELEPLQERLVEGGFAEILVLPEP